MITCNAAWDLTDATSIPGFVISATQPPDTECRVIFKIDGELFRFVNGILDKYIWRGELDDVLIYGNTVGELLELQNITAFAGKKVFPIIALSAPSNADVFPKLKLEIKWATYLDLYQTFCYSPTFELPAAARIATVKKIATTTGNATEITECRIKKLTGWSDWENYLAAENQIASAIQFRTKFVVSTLDETDSAAIDSITVNFSDDYNCDCSPTQHFFTKVESYDADLHKCYLLVKHKAYSGADLTAFVSMKPAREVIENYVIGTGTGEVQTFNLPKNYAAQDTLCVEVDGVPVFDYEFDTQAGALTLTATAGAEVAVSYEVIRGENWQVMLPDFASLDKTRFTFTTTSGNLRECAVRFMAEKRAGELPVVEGYIAGFAV